MESRTLTSTDLHPPADLSGDHPPQAGVRAVQISEDGHLGPAEENSMDDRNRNRWTSDYAEPMKPRDTASNTKSQSSLARNPTGTGELLGLHLQKTQDATSGLIDLDEYSQSNISRTDNEPHRYA